VGIPGRVSLIVRWYQTRHQAWTDHHTEHGYVLRDPMTAWRFSTIGPTWWSDKSSLDPFGLFKDAAGHGLNDGATIAWGKINSRTIASVARSDRGFADAKITRVSSLVVRLHVVTER